MSLIEKLESSGKQRGILFEAVERLQNAEEMRAFYNEYAAYVTNYNKRLAQQDPKYIYLAFGDHEYVATKNIVGILGFYDRKTSDRWRRALPEVDALFKEFYPPLLPKLRKRIYKPELKQ